MTEPQTLGVYTDYKSPYAYLAKDLVYELERDLFGCASIGCLIGSSIPSFLGSARLDDNGRVIEEQRNAHQWRRVRYSYMDCRRQARKRGLVIRGTQKIWDSTLALCGMLYAKRQEDAVLRRYHDTIFERFWKRDLDIGGCLPRSAGCWRKPGAGPAGFPDYLVGPGTCRAGQHLRHGAEAIGVFGVPTFVLAGEIFWGREHLPEIREMLGATA